MIACVHETIEKYHMLEGVNHVIVGLSGGPDSVALVQVLHHLKNLYHYELEAIHLNHLLRGEASDQDQVFCQDLCKQLKIPLYLYKEDIALYSKHHKLSLEEAGRQVRYKLFAEHLKDHSVIALGHHQDDLAETMLYNLIRGTGLKGLAGIPPVRDGYIRPLFEVCKQQIIAFLNDKGYHYQMDETNMATDYTRNKIRLELIPYIEASFNPQFKKSMGQLSAILREDEMYLDIEAQKIYLEVVGTNRPDIALKAEQLLHHSYNMRRRVYEISLLKLVQPLKNIGYVHYKQIDDLLTNETGKYTRLPANILITKETEWLTFKHNIQIEAPSEFKVDEVVPLDQEWIFQKENLTIETKFVSRLEEVSAREFYLDLDRLQGKLQLRNRMPGDKIFLTGLGHKKLKKWCQEQGMSQDMRKELLVLTDETQVIWVLNYLKNDRYKADETSKNILKIKMDR